MRDLAQRERAKNKRKLFGESAVDILYFTAGGVLYALSVNMFTAPNGILPGGFTGAATILNYLFSIPIGTTLFLLNVPLVLIAVRQCGGPFI